MASVDVGFLVRDDFAWARSGDALFFVGTSRDVRNIWRVDVDPRTLEWTGGPERVTTGPGADTDVAVSPDGDRIAFASSVRNARLWVYGFDPTTARISGNGEPITAEGWHSALSDITSDGRRVLSFTTQPGRRPQRHLTELRSGSNESYRLISADLDRWTYAFARWSPDGTRIAYRRWTIDRGRAQLCSIELLDRSTGEQTPLTSPQPGRDNPYGWSPDGRWVVVTGGRYVAGQSALVLLPLAAAPRAENHARLVTSDKCHWLWQAAMSPDGRWVALQAAPRGDTRVSTIYLVRPEGGAWMQLTEGTYWDDKPRWSPDGKILYFASSRGGAFNVWGIRVDPTSGTPAGGAFRVTAFDGSRRMLMPEIGSMEIGIATDRLVLPIVDVIGGGIWMLEDVVR
jgi:Tol biopolymer transport system component